MLLIVNQNVIFTLKVNIYVNNPYYICMQRQNRKLFEICLFFSLLVRIVCLESAFLFMWKWNWNLSKQFIINFIGLSYRNPNQREHRSVEKDRSFWLKMELSPVRPIVSLPSVWGTHPNYFLPFLNGLKMVWKND